VFKSTLTFLASLLILDALHVLVTGNTTKAKVWVTFTRIHFLQLQNWLLFKAVQVALTGRVWIISLFHNVTHVFPQWVTFLCSNLIYFNRLNLLGDVLQFNSLTMSLESTLRKFIFRILALFRILFTELAIVFDRSLQVFKVDWLVRLSLLLLNHLCSDVLKIFGMVKFA